MLAADPVAQHAKGYLQTGLQKTIDANGQPHQKRSAVLVLIAKQTEHRQYDEQTQHAHHVD